MSPVFRHGGLRLYLLKLLDEAPRHGYDVIRLLQDKFLGVYSPSPGTIYPRLARLEEEGLVTHETVDGKKVYRITDAGRAELNRRLDDLADLEDELAASVRDIAMEISRDVRETVRNLRDELTGAVREAGRTGRGAGAGPGTDGTVRAGPEHAGARPYSADRAPSNAEPDSADARGDAENDGQNAAPDAEPSGAKDARSTEDSGAWRDATAEKDETGGPERTIRADAAADAAAADAGAAGAASVADAGTDADEAGSGTAKDTAADSEQAGQRQGRRGRGDWRDWADWAERRDWNEWADWARRQGWGEWASKQEWKDWARASKAEWAQWAQTSRPDWLRGGFRDRREPRPDLISDLEHLAAAFAREIRGVARQAENVSDDAVGNLGRILFDTLNRIRTEVFRAPESGRANGPDQASGTDQKPQAEQSSPPPQDAPPRQD